LFTLYALSRQGRYDLSGLLEAVKHKEFGLILAEGNFFSGGELRGDTWPPQVIEAIRQNYQVKFRDVWFVYEPKP